MKMSLRGLLAGLLCLSGAGATLADAEPRIRNGLETSAFPTTGALLEGPNLGAATLLCSGTLIGCETFVTAAHCVCDSDGDACNPNESRFFVYLQNEGIVGVDTITPHPDYDDSSGDHDLAVLRISPVSGISPTPLAHVPPLFGTSATIAGFGLDDESSEPDRSGLKRFGKLETEDCAPLALMSNDQHVCWSFDTPFGPAGEDSNTCVGDSGGPLFVVEGADSVLAGVTSFGVGSTECSDGTSASSNVANLLAFLEAEAGADLSHATCGSIGHVGGPAAPVFAFAGDLDAGLIERVHSFDVAAGTRELRVTLNGTEGPGADFDLFVRAGSPPDALGGQFDCASTNGSQFEGCALDDPAEGTWYATARRFGGSGSYQLVASALGEPGVCGDGAVHPGEACDDGNTVSGDGCSATCVDENAPRCGDGVVDPGESCDDGNTVSGDGCSALCRVDLGACPPRPALGCESASRKTKLNMQWKKNKLIWQWRDFTTVQGFGDPAAGETDYRLCIYDESEGLPAVALEAHIPAGPAWTAKSNGFRFRTESDEFDGIRKAQLKNSRRAKIKFTGTQMQLPDRILQDDQVVVQLGNSEGACWQGCYVAPAKRNTEAKFVDSESFDCVIPPPPVCGDGVVEPGEACDDGNTTPGDGCSATCAVETSVCGNGIVEPPEACDDGNTFAGDGCALCQIEPAVCGNGVVEPPETCDDGNTIAGDGCALCQIEPAVCGNGIVEPPEACDDGNTFAGDGCALCQIEPAVCGNGVVEPPETCDDGNTIAGDGCEADCTETP